MSDNSESEMESGSEEGELHELVKMSDDSESEVESGSEEGELHELVKMSDNSESEVESGSEEGELPELEYRSDTFTARSYQEELFEIALQKNSILVLGTGSGKTFISILLIKELAHMIRGSLSNGAQRTVFVVNTVPLVYQQGKAIQEHTGLQVGLFEGSMEVDFWSDEKWSAELDKYEVLVMVAQILKDLILHNRLRLDRINLLIMDECHHAVGNHPMREVMREYFAIKCGGIQVPRVMGLTACVIHKKCKPSVVSDVMRELETSMDCCLVTSKDQESVLRFTTKPKEFIICYKSYNSSGIFLEIREKLYLIEKKTLIWVEDNAVSEIDARKVKKFLSKQINGIIDVSNDLGDAILLKAIKLQMGYLMESEPDVSPLELSLCRILGDKLGKLHSNYEDLPLITPGLLSNKVARLIEVLTRGDSLMVSLVFVTRRNTAKLLTSLLLELKNCGLYPGLEYVSPESVVGGNSNPRNDLKVNKEEIKKQKETIERFRKNLCNTIICTSILEEGLDIRKCNVVIRFDEPTNYRAYVQSLGRARAEKSYYIIFSSNVEETLQNVYCYKMITLHLQVHCHDREEPSLEESIAGFLKDFKEEPYAPYGIPGPQVTFNSAIQLINRYCGSLPHDKFTTYAPTVNKRRETINDEERFFVDFTLPMVAPYRKKVTSKPMSNWEDAKKSASLKMCIILHKLNLLDENLLPKKLKAEVDQLVEKHLRIPKEIVSSGMPKPGTRKRRQIYKRKVCKAFTYSNGTEMHLHYICFQHLKRLRDDDVLLDSDGNPIQLGLLTRREIRSSFPLFSKKFGEVNVIVEPIRKLNCSDCDLNDIEQFNCIISKLLLFCLNMNIMDFNLEKSDNFALLVPLTKTEINFDFLRKGLDDATFALSGGNQIDHDSFHFEPEKYDGMVVIPTYRESEILMVQKVCLNETPLSQFPEKKDQYSSYKHYVKTVYNADVSNDRQPLIECKHFSKEFSFLKEIDERTQSKMKESKHPKFIPELCYALSFTASLWYQILCMPSILHRLNGLQLEQELYQAIGYCFSLDKELFSRTVDYNWVKEELFRLLGNSAVNLNIVLRKKNKFAAYPGMILQCLTPLSNNDHFNLERLEILGDSYLKFSVGIYLFCIETDAHEGALTMQRSKIVSNETLYYFAKQKGLPQLFQAVLFQPQTAIPFGFYVREDIESLMKVENVPYDLWPKYHKAGTAPIDREESSSKAPYNPWTEQLVPDKCIADCVEALIGAYLLCGGEQAANFFLQWLGFSFISQETHVPTTAICVDTEDRDTSVDFLYFKYRLSRLEHKLHYTFKERSFLLQAVTHPSFTKNKLTDCYQRLEFLGDAVLDYLVTGYIFSKYKDYDPGALTDLRSHYVKNETLAKVALDFGLHSYLQHMAPKLSGTIDNFRKLVEDGEQEFNLEDDTCSAEDVEVPKALGDLVEALIGAVYVDSNQDLEVTWNLISKLLNKVMEETRNKIPIDSVRDLYEKCPNVKITSVSPTEDSPAECIVKIPGKPELTGTGKNKRTAKQAAAKLALMYLKFNTAAD